jgi:hypothetical protein
VSTSTKAAPSAAVKRVASESVLGVGRVMTVLKSG